MTDKFHSDTQEKVASIVYEANIIDSTDMETGTRTITAVAEASGPGNADYSRSMTLVKPVDARLVVKRIASRLAVTIDSMTTGHLYCRVYVDSQDADHRLFDKDWTSAGGKLDAIDTHAGSKASIFDLLKDGSAHTFYFFFWVNSGNAVISQVQLWEGVGSCNTYPTEAVEIRHEGMMAAALHASRQGSGSSNLGIYPAASTWRPFMSGSSGSEVSIAAPMLVIKNDVIRLYGSVATDMVCVDNIFINIKSQ
jgi:hypothetical protein